MDGNRVFISSVMNGFDSERAAAKQAAALLGFMPYMAEEFGALPQTPREACLEGVRNCDIYVGIFGERYGYVANDSGMSATEEEYKEARELGKPLLCFVSRDEQREDRQAKFLQGVMDYCGGLGVAFYDSPSDLKDQVTKSLSNLKSEGSQPSDVADKASDRVNELTWGPSPETANLPTCGAVIVPELATSGCFPISLLDSQQFQKQISQILLFGASPLFDIESGISTQEGDDYLQFFQEKERRGEKNSSLTIYLDGAITFSQQVRGATYRPMSIVRNVVVDQELILAFIKSVLNTAGDVFQQANLPHRLSRFRLGFRLDGLEGKCIGTIPNPEPNSITMPHHNLGNTVRFPDEICTLQLSHLSQSAELVDSVFQQLLRRCRVSGAMYSPNSQFGGRSPFT